MQQKKRQIQIINVILMHQHEYTEQYSKLKKDDDILKFLNLMIMKRFLVSNLFALILFVVASSVIMSLDLAKESSTLLVLVLAIGVVVYAATRLLKFEKDNKIVPVINFDQQRIECQQTGKILYQFTTIEWDRLSIDEKYDVLRWFTLA